MTTRNVFRHPRPVRDYGYSDGELVKEPGSPSGFLLGWEAIDDQAEAPALVEHCQYAGGCIKGHWANRVGIEIKRVGRTRREAPAQVGP